MKELVDLCVEPETPKLVHQVSEQAIRISSKSLHFLIDYVCTQCSVELSALSTAL